MSVRVVGVYHAPLPGVRLKVEEPAREPRYVVADERGHVRVPDVPFDETATIGLPRPTEAQRKPVPITGPEVQVFLWGELPLRVDLLDAKTGCLLEDARWARDDDLGVSAHATAPSGGTLCVPMSFPDRYGLCHIDFDTD